MNKGRRRLVAAHDAALDRARDIVEQARAGAGRAEVRSFFDEPTFTASYVVHDPATKRAAIIDSVLDFDAAAGRTSYASAQAIVAYVRSEDLTVAWLIETHAHADHCSAATWLQHQPGGKLMNGREILPVPTGLGKDRKSGVWG